MMNVLQWFQRSKEVHSAQDKKGKQKISFTGLVNTPEPNRSSNLQWIFLECLSKKCSSYFVLSCTMQYGIYTDKYSVRYLNLIIGPQVREHANTVSLSAFYLFILLYLKLYEQWKNCKLWIFPRSGCPCYTAGKKSNAKELKSPFLKLWSLEDTQKYPWRG